MTVAIILVTFLSMGTIYVALLARLVELKQPSLAILKMLLESTSLPTPQCILRNHLLKMVSKSNLAVFSGLAIRMAPNRL